MAASHQSFSMEKRPRMLKDFLVDDQIPAAAAGSNSSSNNDLIMQLMIRISRSKAIRLFPIINFGAINKSTRPAAINLSRSISRKLSIRRKKEERKNVLLVDNKVKIKDILRWKSFRDVNVVSELADDDQQEQEITKTSSFARSTTQNYHHCATSSSTISSGSSSSCSRDWSSSSSWCESDFTVEDDLSSNCCCAGEDNNGGTASMRELFYDEEDQHSPVSVLQSSPFQGQEFFFHRSLSTLQRRKCRLLQRIQEFETLATEEEEEDELETNINGTAVDQKARKLLGQIKTTQISSAKNDDDDHLLLDFFRQELMGGGKIVEDHHEGELLRLAESWLNKESAARTGDWEMLGKREEFVRDMEKCGLKFNGFEDEQQELGCVLESEMLNDLIHEILVDLFN